jgi:hypothetical protein
MVSGERFGGRTPWRWGPLGSNDREEKLERVASFAGWAGLMDSAHEENVFLLFQSIFHTTQKWKIIPGKYLGSLEIYENFPEGRLEYLELLLFWALWPKVNEIQMKNWIQLWI